jgi:DNA-binding XRE family transcriptional regulator
MAEKSEQIEENLVKKTCRELGITQKELAKIMEVTPHTITDWGRGNLRAVHKLALQGMITNKKYLALKNILKNVSDGTF